MRGLQRRKDSLIICDRCNADLSRSGALRIHQTDTPYDYSHEQLFECVKCGNIVSFGKSNKYNAIRSELNGIRFASKLEADRYKQLMELQRAGKITKLKLQVQFVIARGYIDPRTGEKMRPVVYVADFMYFDTERKIWVVEDTKGIVTNNFSNKWRQCREEYPEYEWKIITREDIR